jgi:hypothetical protein
MPQCNFILITSFATSFAPGRGAGFAAPPGILSRKAASPVSFFRQIRPAPVKLAVRLFLLDGKQKVKLKSLLGVMSNRI